MSVEDDPIVELIARLVPVLLRALYALEFAARHLAPPTLAQLVEAIQGRQSDLDEALERSRALDWPQRLLPARKSLESAAAFTSEALAGLVAAPADDLSQHEHTHIRARADGGQYEPRGP